MSTKESTIKLKNKLKVPVIGFDATTPGFHEIEETKEALREAIDAGYLLFYCFPFEDKEKAVGEVLKEMIDNKKIDRDHLFIITKVFWDSSSSANYAENCLRLSLENLKLNYVDLALLHTPVVCNQEKVDYKPAWRGMENCFKNNLTRGIGLSNFNVKQMTRLLKITKIKPVVNKVECNIFFNQKSLRKLCKKKKIVIIAENPLGPADYPENQPINQRADSPHRIELNELSPIKILAAKYRKTNRQIAVRYLIDTGSIPLLKSLAKQNIRDSIDVFNFQLTKREIKVIKSIDDGTYDPHKSMYTEEEQEFLA